MRKSIRWDKLSKEDLQEYKSCTESELSKVRINHELILCDNPQCTDPSHINAIDRMYSEVLDALHESSSKFTTRKKGSYKQVLGWNSYCKELHSIARDAYLIWQSNGRQTHGLQFSNIKRTRAQFKHALRQCKQESSRAQANLLAKNCCRKMTCLLEGNKKAE